MFGIQMVSSMILLFYCCSRAMPSWRHFACSCILMGREVNTMAMRVPYLWLKTPIWVSAFHPRADATYGKYSDTQCTLFYKCISRLIMEQFGSQTWSEIRTMCPEFELLNSIWNPDKKFSIWQIELPKTGLFTHVIVQILNGVWNDVYLSGFWTVGLITLSFKTEKGIVKSWFR